MLKEKQEASVSQAASVSRIAAQEDVNVIEPDNRNEEFLARLD